MNEIEIDAPRGWIVTLFVAAALCAAMSTHAARTNESTPEESKPVEVSERKTSDRGFAISATSKSDVPVTVIVDFPQMQNFKCSVKTPIGVVVQPGKTQVVAKLSLVNPRAVAGYKLQWTYFYGWRGEKTDDSPYVLPYPIGYAYRITQGFNGTFSHQGRNAIDFGLPEGSTVCAARGGTVVEVVRSNTESGIKEELKSKANRVLILHDDGTVAQYAHLAHNGAKVKLGQKVRAGEAIGISGATGYARGPHLHFEVDRPPKSGNESEAITMRFVARSVDGREQTVDPKEGTLCMRPIPANDPNAGRTLPINAVDNLITCRKISDGRVDEITDSFSAREPMYVTMRLNFNGTHDAMVLIYSENIADKTPAVFDLSLSKDPAGDLIALKLDLPDEQSKIRGRCVVKVTIDQQEVASTRFEVGS